MLLASRSKEKVIVAAHMAISHSNSRTTGFGELLPGNGNLDLLNLTRVMCFLAYACHDSRRSSDHRGINLSLAETWSIRNILENSEFFKRETKRVQSSRFLQPRES